MAVTAVVTIVMAVWGFSSLTAPIDDDGFSAAVSPEDEEVTCGAGEVPTNVRFLTSREVVVSVYNAGKRKGRATDTLNLLEDAGFAAGAIGNDPESGVQFVEIHIKESDRTKAQLLAKKFGRNAQIVVDNEKDLKGPGVNVVIGDKFNKLRSGVPNRIRLPEPVTVCR